MRTLLTLLLALLVTTAPASTSAGEDGAAPGPRRAPPPPPGIHWERDFEAGMARAAREGRPLLFAVNALETERANNMLAAEAYRSASWGEATRAYAAFVCNPEEHAPGEGACTRYPGHTCASHKAALAWFLERFGVDLISPQHVILEPDGDVAWRKEYYTGVVGPILLESQLSRLAPRLAYARAGVGREARMRRLGEAPVAEIPQQVASWLAADDGLAAAAILNVLDETDDEARRLALVGALARTPPIQVYVLQMAVEDAVAEPLAAWTETLAWLRTLFAVDREVGTWAARRVLVRVGTEGERDAVLRVWAGVGAEGPVPGVADLPAFERPYAFEALILAGDRRARGPQAPEGWSQGRRAEIARARSVTGLTAAGGADLAAALEDGRPGPLRRALLEATAEEIVARGAAVRALLAGDAPRRVRIAAALALLRARDAAAPVAQVVAALVRALRDPIEGREARAAAVAILDADPGQGQAAWSSALEAHLRGEAK